MIRDRFFSFTMVLGTGFLLLVSLLLTTTLSAVGRSFIGESFDQTVLWRIVNFVVSLLATWVLFTLIFKVIPDVKIAWRDVLLGAALTAALFAVGRWLLGLYLANASTTSAYGAAGSLVLLLIWVYYSAQILFLGAEFTQVYARRYGSRIEPSKNAVPVTEQARANQGMPRKEDVAAGKVPSPEQAREVGGTAPRDDAPPSTPARQSRADAPAADTLGSAAAGRSRAAIAGLALLSGVLGIITGRRRQ
jgi:membrane protein